MHLFSVIIAIGTSFGLWRVYKAVHPSHALKSLLTGFWLLAGSLVGARVGYILLHLSFFTQHQDQMVKFWLGGLNGFGALLGAVLFTAIAALLLKMNLLKLLDLMSWMILPLVMAIWLGCWSVGLAYGHQLGNDVWWGILSKDEGGIFSLRFPLQPLAAISIFVLFHVLERFIKESPSGNRFLASGLVLSIHTLVFSLLRADPVQRLYNLRLDVFLSILFVIIFTFLCIIFFPGRTKKAV